MCVKTPVDQQFQPVWRQQISFLPHSDAPFRVIYLQRVLLRTSTALGTHPSSSYLFPSSGLSRCCHSDQRNITHTHTHSLQLRDQNTLSNTPLSVKTSQHGHLQKQNCKRSILWLLCSRWKKSAYTRKNIFPENKSLMGESHKTCLYISTKSKESGEKLQFQEQNQAYFPLHFWHYFDIIGYVKLKQNNIIMMNKCINY